MRAQYEALRFRHEGTVREIVHRDGQCHDMYIYGPLKRECQPQPALVPPR